MGLVLSPYDFSDDIAFVRSVNDYGYAIYDNEVSFSGGVRPVLNLKSGSLKSGSGTAEDPYTV